MMENFEQVPHTTVTRQDDGIRERLHVLVQLPGINSVSEFTVRIQPGSLKLHSPGKYQLDLKLDAVVDEKPEVLKFVKKRSEFRAVLLVVESIVPQEQQKEARASRPEQPALHESFLAEAAKLRDTGKKTKAASGGRAGKGKEARGAKAAAEPEPEPEPEAEPEGYVEWTRRTRRNRRTTPGWYSTTHEVVSEPASCESDAADTDTQPAEGVDGPSTPPSESGLHRTGRRSQPTDSDDAAPEQEPAAPQDPSQQESPAEGTEGAGGGAPGADLMQQAMAALKAGEHARAASLAREAAEKCGTEDPRIAYLLEFCELLTGNTPPQEAPAQETTPSHVQEDAKPARSEAAEEAASPSPRASQSAGETGSPADAGAHSGRGGSQPRKQKSKKGRRKEEVKEATPSSTPKAKAGKSSKNSWQAGAGPEETSQPPQSPRTRTESPRAKPQPKAKKGSPKPAERKGIHWTVARFLWALLLLVCRAVLRVAPSFLEDAAALLKWTRLARFLLAKRQQDGPAGSAVTVASCLAFAVTCYCGCSAAALAVYMAHASLMASVSSAVYLASASLRGCAALAKSLLWAPSLWPNLVTSVALRYSYCFGGKQRWCVLAFGFWGWPLMMHSTGGGLLGWLTLPACLGASMWDTSHWNLIFAFWFTRKLLVWIRLPLLLARIASLLFGCVLLLLLRPIDGERRKSGQKSAAEKPASGPRDVPEGAEGEVARVLAAADLYEVLLVPREADGDALRKAKRVMALATHPDKLGQATGSNEAFARVTEAYDVLSDSKRRAEYDLDLRIKLEERQVDAEMEPQPEEQGMYFQCPTCLRSCLARYLDRPLERARYCSQCKKYHPAKEGDGWFESAGLFGQKVKVYVCLDGKVVDMSHWMECSSRFASHKVEVNTHAPAFDFGAGLYDSEPAASSSRSNKKAKGRRRK